MIGFLVAGLLFLVVLVFAIMSWKQWHWTNSIFLILSFIAAVAATAGAAKVLTLRSQQIKDLEASEINLVKAEEAASVAIYGPFDRQDYGPQSLRGLNEALLLELMGRGRVWRNGTVDAGADGQNRFFKFSQAGAEGLDGQSELTNIQMYVFQETWDGDVNYPNTFLGTVRIVNQTGEHFEISPQFVVDPVRFNEGGSWTLYERMPGDRHDVFIKANGLDRKTLTIPAYRELLMSEEIFSAESMGMDPASGEYEAFIDQFAFDGFTIGEIESYIEENAATRVNKRFQPSPEEVFVQYKFLSKSAREYTVDASGNLNIDGPFTLLGEAIDKTLHLGAKVGFVKDQEVLIDQVTADGYQRYDQTQIPAFSQIENVTEVGRIYRRKLHDFPVLFSDFRREAQDLAERAAKVSSNNVQTKLTLDEANNQIQVRGDAINRYRDDNENLASDLAVISKVLEERTDQLADLQGRIESLEQKIEMLRAAKVGGAE